jgi:AP endonuclease-2
LFWCFFFIDFNLYLGVATFCRVPASIPIAADEGFSGLLHSSKGVQVVEDTSRVGFYDDVLNSMPHDELLRLDNEGRCIVTDHGSFG